MKKLLFLPLLFAACTPAADKTKLDAVIEQQLRAGPQQRTAFLTLNYGDDRADVASKLALLREAGTVTAINADRENEHPLPSEAEGYKFTTPYELKVLNWFVTPDFHNDSLVGIHLFSFVNEEPTLEYRLLENKYAAVYGPAVTSTPLEAVFVKGSQRVDLSRDKESLTIRYKNTALEKRVSKILTKCYFDKHGNSYDSSYYKRVVLPREKVNPDKI